MELAISEVTHDAAGMAAVQAIREKVFIVEQLVPADLEYENESESHHFLITANGQPAGTARWRLTCENKLKIERCAVPAEYRGTGVGKAVVQYAIADAQRAYPGLALYLNAQLSAEGFYEKMGFVTEGRQFVEAGIVHVRMILADE